MYDIARKYPDNYNALTKSYPEELIYIYIFKYLLGRSVPEIGEGIPSFLRINDKNPSFFLYTNGNKIKWKDHGFIKPMGNNAISLYQHVKKITNFRTALNSLWGEISSPNIILSKQIQMNMARLKEKKETQAGLKFKRNWKPEEFAYWEKHGFSKKLLDKYNVYPCRIAWLDYHVWHKSSLKDPMYVYLFGLNPEQWQLYRPLTRAKKNKFRIKGQGNLIMGWNKLPPSGPIVVLTSSYKDIITFASLNIPAVALGSESNMHLFPEEKIQDLKKRFKTIICVMDNDKTGIESSKEVTLKWNFIKEWQVPQLTIGCKDPSDVLMSDDYGVAHLKRILNQGLKPLLNT